MVNKSASILGIQLHRCASAAIFVSLFMTTACGSSPKIVPTERTGADATEEPVEADTLKDVSEDAATIIKRSLQAPGSFQYINGKTLWRGNMNSPKPQYVVLIGYDAQNGFGANLRGCSMVAFTETSDGKLEWSGALGVSEKDRNLCEDESENTKKQAVEEGQEMASLNFDAEKKHEDNPPPKPKSISDIAAHINDGN